MNLALMRRFTLSVMICLVAFSTACQKCKNCKKSEDTASSGEAAGPAPDSETEAPAPATPPPPPLENSGDAGALPQRVGCVAWKKAQTPETLSKTGCFDPQDLSKTLARVYPYEVNAPFWSDGAEKKRWFALPPGGQVAWNPAGLAEFPRGSVLIKEFARGGKKLETRFFVLQDDGKWAGYSYEWNSAGTDARFIGERGKVVDTGDGQQWSFPAQRDCFRCHSQVMNFTLGWELPQINVASKDAAGQLSWQLLEWQKLGLVSNKLGFNPAEAPHLTSPHDSSATLPLRARAYLHANCAFCHRAGSSEPSNFDFRASLSFTDMKICNIVADLDDLGVPEARMFKPLLPEQSIIHMRLVRNDYARMPPLASLKLDDEGGILIRDWIKNTPDCNQP